MINFVIGRAGQKCSEPVYKVLESLPKEKKAFVVVPEQFSYETERKILGESLCNMQTEVLSLKRLAYRLSSETDIDINVLSKEGFAILIKRAVCLCAEELNIFKSTSGSAGFVDEVRNFIDEIKKGGLSHTDLICDEKDTPSVKMKLNDIRRIYETYESLVGESVINTDDYFSFVAENAKDNRLIKDSVFIFDGFYSFDACEYPLISLVMRDAENTSFILHCDDEPFFKCSMQTLNELISVAKENSLDYKITKIKNDSMLSAPVAFLEEHLMSYDAVAYTESTDVINLARADDINEECDFVACEINRLIKEKNYRFGDFRIICTDKSYFTVLSDVMKRHDIDHFIDENRAVSSTSAVRAFLGLLSMLDKSYTTTELISFAKTGFSSLDEREYMLLENYVLEMGIKNRMWESPFERNNTEQSYDLKEINALREKLTEPINKIRKEVLGYNNVSEFVKSFTGSLETVSFEEKLQECIDRFISDEDYENANIYAQINNKILLILSQLESFFGNDMMSIKEIYDVLSYALSASTVGIIPARVDAVSIGDVIRSTTSENKVLFFMGCNEGKMPSNSYEQPVFTDQERKQMHSLKLKNNSDYQRIRDNFVCYLHICFPKELLYLTRTTKDGSEEVYPSVIYERVDELFPDGRKIICSEELLRPDMIDTDRFAFRKMTDLLSEMISQGINEDKQKTLSSMISVLDDDGTRSLLSISKDGFAFDNGAKIYNRKLYSSLLPDPFVTSVSMLETYGKCPFSFFMRYVIKPKERRLKNIRSTDTGNILHMVVEEFSRAIIECRFDCITCSDEDIELIAKEIVDKVLREYKDGIVHTVSNSIYLYRKLVSNATAAIKEIISQIRISDFRIGESEMYFGFDARYDAIEIKTKDEISVFVRGIIDRIDFASIQNGRFLKIVDYKSSKTSFDLSKCLEGINVQLPVYAMAVRDDTQDVAGVFYFRLSPGLVDVKKQSDMDKLETSVRKELQLRGITLKDISIVEALDNKVREGSYIADVAVDKKTEELKDSQSLLTRDEFNILLEKTKQSIASAAEGILGADIEILPYRYAKTENACTYCEYSHICKFSVIFDKNAYRIIEKKDKSILQKGEDK
ncbi:MAG: hypothetical protein E7218_00780 [Anaerofustis stercorihominis]|nr:hypothetical protein [Anaerofustis stercorihominis]